MAKSRTEGLDDKSLSYRGQFAYDHDHYGLELDRLVEFKSVVPFGSNMVYFVAIALSSRATIPSAMKPTSRRPS